MSTPFDAQISEQMKAAMKAKEQVKLDTLRAMKSALKYKMVELKKDELNEQDCQAVFKTLVKQRQDSIDQFTKSGAPERAESEKAEIEVIQAFLPEPLSEDEMKAMVEEAIKKTGASSMKEMGAVMKEVNAAAQGRADGKTLSEIVKSRLSA